MVEYKNNLHRRLTLLNILFFGDIVGHPGRNFLLEQLPSLKERYQPDLCIANAENSAAGFGINQKIAKSLFDSGIHILTMGNHTFARPDFFRIVDTEKRIIRPANVSKHWPGFGSAVFDAGEKGKVLVINVLGRVGMNPCDSPYACVDQIIDNKESLGTKIVIVDFHAEATSEKVAMGHYLDGRVSLVLGTHTHVQTADESILPRGTGHISDVGMTGAVHGVLGMKTEASLRRLVDQLPAPYESATGPAMINAVFSVVDEQSGKCLSIERINIKE
jgi:metallophosphoesterase (TIGR00282 family)